MTDEKENNEVSGYGNPSFSGDTNDHWRIQLVDPITENNAHVKAIETRFRLQHVNTGRILASNSVKLPKWGLFLCLPLVLISQRLGRQRS